MMVTVMSEGRLHTSHPVPVKYFVMTLADTPDTEIGTMQGSLSTVLTNTIAAINHLRDLTMLTCTMLVRWTGGSYSKRLGFDAEMETLRGESVRPRAAADREDPCARSKVAAGCDPSA
jgi:hypothetical protein